MHRIKDITDKMLEKCLSGPDGRTYSALELEAIMMESWSNNSCLGYVIQAMEKLECQESLIEKVVSEIKHEGFEFTTLEEADQIYRQSKY